MIEIMAIGGLLLMGGGIGILLVLLVRKLAERAADKEWKRFERTGKFDSQR